MKKERHTQLQQPESAELPKHLRDSGVDQTTAVLEKTSSKRKPKSDRQSNDNILSQKSITSSVNKQNPHEAADVLANKPSGSSVSKGAADVLSNKPIARFANNQNRKENIDVLADEPAETVKRENLEDHEVEERDANSSVHENKKKRRVSFGGVSVLGVKSETAPEGGGEKTGAPSSVNVNIGEKRSGGWRAESERKDLVWGNRFTKEEDELLKKTILDYFKSNGGAGLDSLNVQHLKGESGFWSEIARFLPHRPIRSIYLRAHRLLDGRVKGKWSKEEENLLRSLYEESGHNWRKISTILGRSRFTVKDKWRLLKLERTKGQWSQQELTKLCDMVHENLRVIAKLGKHKNENDHRKLRDNINWQVISDRLGSRPHSTCANEWYRTLASSMVAKGEWATGDDRIFLLRLLEVGENDEEAVEWDELLRHRSGSICRKRWTLMVKHLGESSHLPFGEKLKLLTQLLIYWRTRRRQKICFVPLHYSNETFFERDSYQG